MTKKVRTEMIDKLLPLLFHTLGYLEITVFETQIFN